MIYESGSPYAFHVEHIRPIKHSGLSELDNLAWSCFSCNIVKSTDVASFDEQSGALTPLFNPRTGEWDDHFALQRALIIGKTAIGRVTIKLLQLNHPRQIEAREGLIEAGLW